MTLRPAIGFVILSHESDERLARLVGALNREYADPPIVIHHDFGQARVDVSMLPRNVTVLDDWVPTGWAKWSVVEGALRAFRHLLDTSDADWAFLLSAADYPIRRGDQVRAELAGSDCDAFIDLRPCDPASIPRARTVGKTSPIMAHMDTPANHAIKTRFTMSPQLWLPIIRRRPRWRIGRVTWRPPIAGRHPFTAEHGSFYGDHWWGGNRKAIEAVLEKGGFAERLRRHLRTRTQPDESYYATVLAARDDLTLCLDNRRFAQWNGGGAHPQAITMGELEPMLTSGCYFARKFAPEDKVRDAIDAHLAEKR